MNMKRLLSIIALLAIGYSLKSQLVYNIYDGPAPGTGKAGYEELIIPSRWAGTPVIYNVTVPTVTVYRPAPQINTGAAVIIAPGGGNIYLTWQEEGINVAEWFQRHGITGIILKYRTEYMGRSEEEIYQNVEKKLAALSNPDGKVSDRNPMMKLAPSIQGDDGRQAIKYVRAHAAELGVDPGKIGIIGFSAGGILTCNVMFFHDKESRPDFAAPIYGSVGEQLPEDPCPTFICGPEFDIFEPENAFNLYRPFYAANIPAELHYISQANHGQGLQYDGSEWNEWIELLYNFLKAQKIVE